MGDEWDAEDFEPSVVPTTTLTHSSKWEGEDEDDDVKESWEDDEEEKKDEEKKEVTAPVAKSKGKKLAEKIAEKEKLKQAELEKKLAEEEAAMTPEERAAEKLQRQHMQEESDLLVALETFGVSERSGNSNLDSFNPNTKEEFNEFCDALTEKISSYKAKEEFPVFVSDLVKNICLHLSSFDLKNLKSSLENLCLEKQKLEKGDKNKKPGKGKGKAKLNVESDLNHAATEQLLYTAGVDDLECFF